MIDQECFTQAWHSYLEPGHSVVKVLVGEPSLSSLRRVPKPTEIYSTRAFEKRKGASADAISSLPCLKSGDSRKE